MWKWSVPRTLAWCALCTASVCYQTSYAQEPLKLLFEIREPFAYKNSQGKVSGILAETVERALNKANIPFEWVETPFKRQFSVIERNDQASCALGVFKNTERSRYGKFSAAVFHDEDRPSIMLTHRDLKMPPSLDLLQALSHKGARLLKKETASYGQTIDEAIERSKVQVVTTTAESRNMAKMIVARRADFIFVSAEEAKRLIKGTPNGDQLYIYEPSGMPQVQDRYLMCTQRVPDELLKRFNQALTN